MMGAHMKRPLLATSMTPFPHSVKLDARIEDACALMSTHSIRHIPVSDGLRVVGVITDRDVKAAERLVPNLQTYPVSVAYVDAPYVVDIRTRMDEVLEEMVDRHIGSAIVTRRDKLVGIFTYVDACRVFAAHIRELRGDDSGPDEAA